MSARRASLLERIRFFLSGRKETPVGTALIRGKAGRPEWAPRDYATFAREGYQENPYVFRAIQLRAFALSSLRWTASRKRRDGSLEELDNHPLLDLLANPNPSMGRGRFFEEIESYLLISGNSYVAAIGPTSGENAGKPRELWTLRPDRMQIVPGVGPFIPIGGYEYRVDGSAPVKFMPADVLHLKKFHPTNDFYGLAPIEPGGRSIDMNTAGRNHNSALLKNGASPSGALLFKSTLTEDQRAQITKQMNEEHKGTSNAGSIFVSEGDGAWEQMGLSPKDMDWLEGQRLSARESVLPFGVPPEMTGDTANKIFNSFGEARKSFWQDTMLPEADWIRDELNRFLAPRFGDDVRLDYDLDAIEALREDRRTLWTALDTAYKSGTLWRNEARSAMGYGEDEFDFYLTPASGTVETEMPQAPEIPDLEAPSGSDDKSLVFDLKSASKRAQHFKSLDRRRGRWLKSIRISALKLLRKQQHGVLEAVRGASSSNGAAAAAERAVLSQKSAWEKFFRSVYVTVGRDFALATFRGLKAHGPTQTKAVVFLAKADEEQLKSWQELVDAWLKKNSGRKIQEILSTDSERIRKQLAEGVDAGEGIPELADRIEEYLEPLYANRAVTVARTEVIPASNLGSQLAARATGLTMTKTWISSEDDRTRDAHVAADGQTVPLAEPYSVGGEEQMFPGDSSLGASPENTINERCSEGYSVTEEE